MYLCAFQFCSHFLQAEAADDSVHWAKESVLCQNPSSSFPNQSAAPGATAPESDPHIPPQAHFLKSNIITMLENARELWHPQAPLSTFPTFQLNSCSKRRFRREPPCKTNSPVHCRNVSRNVLHETIGIPLTRQTADFYTIVIACSGKIYPLAPTFTSGSLVIKWPAILH